MRTLLDYLAGLVSLLGGLAVVVYGLPLMAWAVQA